MTLPELRENKSTVATKIKKFNSKQKITINIALQILIWKYFANLNIAFNISDQLLS